MSTYFRNPEEPKIWFAEPKSTFLDSGYALVKIHYQNKKPHERVINGMLPYITEGLLTKQSKTDICVSFELLTG